MANDLPVELRAAERRAAETIQRYGISAPEHIRLKDIAFDLGVTVKEGPLVGAAGSLVRIGEFGTIRIPSDQHPERKRFSIAHELGHFVLKHGHSIQRLCSDEDMFSWYTRGEETEANIFAAELMLPRTLIEKRCDVREVNLFPIRELSNEFRSSLTATAIRFVRFCPEMCAVVFSQDSMIRWYYKSEDWWPRISRGQKLDQRTLAYDFFRGKAIPDEPEEIQSDAWIDRKLEDDLVEHSLGSTQFNFVLTILWIRP